LKSAQVNSLRDCVLKKNSHKKGLVEWLKVKALSSNPRTSKKSVSMGTGSVTQVGEHLPSKCKALSSNPNTTTKKKVGLGLGRSAALLVLPLKSHVSTTSMPGPNNTRK
jgi:hypothetical protein